MFNVVQVKLTVKQMNYFFSNDQSNTLFLKQIDGTESSDA